MARQVILSTSGETVQVEAGESSDVVATFYDMGGDAFVKSSLVTLTATLINASDSTVINSRNAQDILDANGGTVTTGGVLTLKLQPLDNVIVAATAGQVESHYLLITWTWLDAAGVTRTGKQEWELFVRVLPTPV